MTTDPHPAVVDRTTAPTEVFEARLAAIEVREADPDGTVEKVARAIWEAGLHRADRENPTTSTEWPPELDAFMARHTPATPANNEGARDE